MCQYKHVQRIAPQDLALLGQAQFISFRILYLTTLRPVFNIGS